MLIVIIALGSTDLLFALDSIPAIYGLTQEPYLVFTANVFALMGLRQLYFLIGGLLRKLVYLSLGLSVILAFIGVKLVFHAMHEYHLAATGLPFGLRDPDLAVAVRDHRHVDHHHRGQPGQVALRRGPRPVEAGRRRGPRLDARSVRLREHSSGSSRREVQPSGPRLRHSPSDCAVRRPAGGGSPAVGRLDRPPHQVSDIGGEHHLDGLQHLGRDLVEVRLVALAAGRPWSARPAERRAASA